MQAAVAMEPGMPAVEARERLVEFVAEMAAGLGHVRRRENALVYVRGLIEHGGRKSLQPTRFGSVRTRRGMSRCSSSWPTRRGIRRC